jgi:hypothetical protein
VVLLVEDGAVLAAVGVADNARIYLVRSLNA